MPKITPSIPIYIVEPHLRESGQFEAKLAMLKMSNLLDIGERTESGLPLIKDTWEKQGWPEVSVTEEFYPERVQTVLAIPSKGGDPKLVSSSMGIQPRMASNIQSDEGKSSLKSSLKILEVLQRNSYCTYDVLAETIGTSRRAVTKQIQKLRLEGRLRRIGSDKGGHWEVVGKGE